MTHPSNSYFCHARHNALNLRYLRDTYLQYTLCLVIAICFLVLLDDLLASQDPDGKYVKQWVPEVAKLPKKYLHQPWLAPAEAQKSAGLLLGETYPQRITGNAVMQVLSVTDFILSYVIFTKPSCPRQREVRIDHESGTSLQR